MRDNNASLTVEDDEQPPLVTVVTDALRTNASVGRNVFALFGGADGSSPQSELRNFWWRLRSAEPNEKRFMANGAAAEIKSTLRSHVRGLMASFASPGHSCKATFEQCNRAVSGIVPAEKAPCVGSVLRSGREVLNTAKCDWDAWDPQKLTLGVLFPL